eukprot:15440186-Alexandrium_andersonii.AAC.1
MRPVSRHARQPRGETDLACSRSSPQHDLAVRAGRQATHLWRVGLRDPGAPAARLVQPCELGDAPL